MNTERGRTVGGGVGGGLGGGARWVVLKLVTQAVEFAAWVAVARRLPVEQVGVVASGALVARYLGLFADWGAQHVGAGLVVAGQVDRQRALVRTRFAAAGVGTVGYCLVTAVSGLGVLSPLSLLVAARGANLDWISHGQGRPAASVGPGLLAAVVMAASAWVAPSVAGVTSGLAAGAGLGLALSLVVNRSRLRELLVPRRVRESSGRLDEGWMMVLTMSDQMMATADVLLVGWLLSSAAAGVYSTVYRLPNALLLVIGLASTAAVPVVVGRNATRRSATPIRRLIGLGFLAALGVLVAAVPLARTGIEVFGDGYREGRSAMVLLFVAVAVISFTSPLRVVLLADRPGRRLALLFLGAAVANGMLNALLIPLGGLSGAALATVLTQVGLGGALLAMVSRRPSAPEAVRPVDRPALGRPGPG